VVCESYISITAIDLCIIWFVNHIWSELYLVCALLLWVLYRCYWFVLLRLLLLLVLAAMWIYFKQEYCALIGFCIAAIANSAIPTILIHVLSNLYDKIYCMHFFNLYRLLFSTFLYVYSFLIAHHNFWH